MSNPFVQDLAVSSQNAWSGFLSAARQLSDTSDASDPFSRFCASWPERASVKGREPHLDAVFDRRLPDFPTELLPFHDHSDFRTVPPEVQESVLSCGWLAYNAKTIAIESTIISPACMHVINDDVTGISGRHQRQAIAQALVDEAYHILLTSNACDMTRSLRRLEHITLPPFELILRMQQCQDRYAAPWQKTLIQLGTAIVSELVISDYLRLISEAEGIQPLNVLTTLIHRRDESAHSGLFRTLGKSLYSVVNEDERAFLIQAMASSIRWFSGQELNVWRHILRQLSFPNAERMLDDCADSTHETGATLDVASVERLLTEIEIDPQVLQHVSLDEL